MDIQVIVPDVTLQTVVRDATEDGGAATLANLVAAQLVDRIVGYGREDWEGWNNLRRRVTEVRDEEIRAQVAPLIHETLTRGFPKTNNYGEPAGGTTTLSEIIMAEVNKVLTRPVDSSGYRGNQTVLQKIIYDLVHADFQKIAAEQVAAVRKEIAGQAGDAVRGAVQAAMRAR